MISENPGNLGVVVALVAKHTLVVCQLVVTTLQSNNHSTLNMFRNQYDTDVTVWSPEGRLLQVGTGNTC